MGRELVFRISESPDFKSGCPWCDNDVGTIPFDCDCANYCGVAWCAAGEDVGDPE